MSLGQSHPFIGFYSPGDADPSALCSLQGWYTGQTKVGCSRIVPPGAARSALANQSEDQHPISHSTCNQAMNKHHRGLTKGDR